MIHPLSDENCLGQVEAIFNELDRLGYVELLEIELLTWERAGLTKGMDDELLWRFCQKKNCLLVTGNRTGSDGKKSLEYVIRNLVEPTSLLVLTIGNLKRVTKDSEYRIICAHRLAEIVLDIENLRGATRLYS